MAIHDFIANGATTLGQKILCMNAREKNSEYVVNNAPLEIQFNINIATVLDGINGKFVRFNDKPCLK
jgi:hypothetical protein